MIKLERYQLQLILMYNLYENHYTCTSVWQKMKNHSINRFTYADETMRALSIPVTQIDNPTLSVSRVRMLVLWEKLQDVTNDRKRTSTSPIFILIMICTFCCRHWVWWDHVTWPVHTSSSIGVQETNRAIKSGAIHICSTVFATGDIALKGIVRHRIKPVSLSVSQSVFSSV